MRVGRSSPAGCKLADLRAQRLEFIKCQSQSLAALLQALQMQRLPARLPIATGDGLK
jgi:hypothetical protein